MPLDRTRALSADLAAALGLESIPAEADGGRRLTIGGTTTLLLYAEADETLLIVAPLGPLPRRPSYGLVVYLLRNNMFNSELSPFQVALDDAGGLTVWGRLRVAEFTGDRLAGLIGVLAVRIAAMRSEIEEESA
jgi:hypothetical protein